MGFASLIATAIAGLAVAAGYIVKTLRDRRAQQQRQQQYAIAHEGYVETQYFPQAPASEYGVPTVTSGICPSRRYMNTVPVVQYRSEYPWGTNAYIYTIANTPIQPLPSPTCYYDRDGVLCSSQPGPSYNFKSHDIYTNHGRNAPPGYYGSNGQFNPTLNQAIRSEYPWGDHSPSMGCNYDQPRYSDGHGEYTYKFNIPINARVVPYQPQSGDQYESTRVYPDGTISFCKIPNSYDDYGYLRAS